MTKKELEQLKAEGDAIVRGESVAARVVQYTEDADGNLVRGELEPEQERAHARRAWAAKNDVARLRHRLDLTQEAFAQRLCVSVSTLRKWETGAIVPSGAAAALLRIVAARPDVMEVLSEA
ncbi:MAG: helix-turn-helix domain-containing protein [Verrucomicrobiales bacterium]|nr:helix-turn-helix domain-containing protein [Verrucomicrobiales bacterium]